jgi:hypothetical protein
MTRSTKTTAPTFFSSFLTFVCCAAALTATAPGPGDVFNAGNNCTIKWDVAEGDTQPWSTFSIDLMSGSNSNMSLVVNVANSLDGTDTTLSPFNWTCPEVDPYSATYFYQFTSGSDSTMKQWTTRFTVRSFSFFYAVGLISHPCVDRFA